MSEILEQDQENLILIDGMRMSLTFYFVCPDKHMHPVELSFKGIDRENITKELLTQLRDMIRQRIAPQMRLASAEEIDRFEESRGMPSAQANKKEGKTYFIMPGTGEPN